MFHNLPEGDFISQALPLFLYEMLFYFTFFPFILFFIL